MYIHPGCGGCLSADESLQPCPSAALLYARQKVLPVPFQQEPCISSSCQFSGLYFIIMHDHDNALKNFLSDNDIEHDVWCFNVALASLICSVKERM
eukprot:2389812-Ditylum_brightwellii.AAC.1